MPASRWIDGAVDASTRAPAPGRVSVPNLGLLAFFKYSASRSAIEDLRRSAGGDSAGRSGGRAAHGHQLLHIPVDELHHRRLPRPPARDARIPRFILFIAFFPQLVAGPIVRASEFLPQMGRVRRLHWPVVATGLALIVEGYFLKMVCADKLATYVDKYWEHGYRADGNSVVAVWLALLFSGQIFCDFAGYSQIARGCAYLLGYQLPINFRSPYIAGSFKNFWERWHITLSRWLRDYLYVPLGGNRVSTRRTYVNLMLVMLLGGLWHGAAWTYVVWGALHGGAWQWSACWACTAPTPAGSLAARADGSPSSRPRCWSAWIVFRSDSMTSATAFLGNLAAGDWVVPDVWMLACGLVPAAAGRHARLAVARGSAPGHAARRSAKRGARRCHGLRDRTMYASTSDFIYFSSERALVPRPVRTAIRQVYWAAACSISSRPISSRCPPGSPRRHPQRRQRHGPGGPRSQSAAAHAAEGLALRDGERVHVPGPATALAAYLLRLGWVKLVGGLYLLYLPYQHFFGHASGARSARRSSRPSPGWACRRSGRPSSRSSSPTSCSPSTRFWLRSRCRTSCGW